MDAATACLEQVGLGALADADARDLPYGAKSGWNWPWRWRIAGAGASAAAPMSPPPAWLPQSGPEPMARVTALAREGSRCSTPSTTWDAVFGVADRVLVIDGQDCGSRHAAGGCARRQRAPPVPGARIQGRSRPWLNSGAGA